MAGDTNLEKLKKDAEAVFGAASPLGGTMDHSMLEKSDTNKLIFDGYQAQLHIAVKGTHDVMMAWENMDMTTGKHKNFREITDPVTKVVETKPIWLDYHEQSLRDIYNVETDQLTCDAFSRRQFLNQIVASSPLGPMPEEQASGIKGWWQRITNK